MALKSSQQIQRIIDGENYEIRKTLVAYSHMLDQQRELVRQQRLELLCSRAAPRFFEQHAPDRFVTLKSEVNEGDLSTACRTILLWCMDQQWCEHLGSAADLQDVVRLRVLGGNHPLHDFQKQVSAWFAGLFDAVDQHAISTFNAMPVVNGQPDLNKAGVQLPSSTWTYQKDDSLFEDMRDQLLTQPGFSAVAALLAGPLLLLALWVTRKSVR